MLVILGLYRILRHPMYAAALYISLGLTLLTQSLACLAVFCIYLVLILLLIPMEEQGLQGAYGSQYIAYQQKVRKLVPFVF
jgi:protein-S-isoprenylcysteine O-methyltransferase Ste14